MTEELEYASVIDCDDILSGQERARANNNPPEDKKAYMLRYVEALKNRPAHPSKWMKKEAEREAWLREQRGL